MKFKQHRVFLILCLITTQVFAEKMLMPPVANGFEPVPSECHQSYVEAAQPKRVEDVFAIMNTICHKRGGLRILNKAYRMPDTEELSGLLLSCIGDNPNAIIFSCLFRTSYQDL